MTQPVDYAFTFDVRPDGRVRMNCFFSAPSQATVTMDLNPDDAEKIGQALIGQALRSRQRTERP